MAGVDIIPLVQEYEQAMGFYGMAFGEMSLHIFAPDDALQFTTAWGDPFGELKDCF